MVHDESGFSLLETLVAFTVLSLVLLSAMELFGDGTKRVALAQQRVSDLIKLQNAMALVRSGVDLGNLEKDIRVRIREVGQQSYGKGGLRPYDLEVSAGTGENLVKLKTIILREK